MRKFTMQDRSDGVVNSTDHNLTLQGVYNMTDYTDEEFDAIACLEVGKELLIGHELVISVTRTA